MSLYKYFPSTPLSLMNRAELAGTLSKWKWPVVGVAAAFVGSMYTFGFSSTLGATLKASNGQEDATNSLGLRELLQKLIHSFVQGNKGPEKPPLSPREASEILRRNEKRTEVNVGIVSYFETNNFASNSPLEDRNAEFQLTKTVGGTGFGVFDGHGGWQCAEMVKDRLPFYIALSLLQKSDLSSLDKEMSKGMSPEKFVAGFPQENIPIDDTSKSSNVGYTLSQKQEVFHTGPKYLVKSLLEKSFDGRLPVSESLNLAFTHLDDDISTEAIPVKVLDDSFVAGATGTCAMVSYIEGQHLYVANTGDCRAVLGSMKPDGSWLATPLSVDQTAKNEEEVTRLYSEHPGEENFVIKNDRLLGQLQPLRSFGDIQYKWDKVTHSHVLTQVYGGPIVPPSMYKTPPYLTAKPVVTHHHLQSQDKFVILATDGLWDVLSNEQAVSLVAHFLEQTNNTKRIAEVDDSQSSGDEVLEHNAATHLIRHALGGNDHSFVAQMLLVPEQYRRMWRDDITVTVVFFDSETGLMSKL